MDEPGSMDPAQELERLFEVLPCIGPSLVHGPPRQKGTPQSYSVEFDQPWDSAVQVLQRPQRPGLPVSQVARQKTRPPGGATGIPGDHGTLRRRGDGYDSKTVAFEGCILAHGVVG